jgi:hypothetical protein
MEIPRPYAAYRRRGYGCLPPPSGCEVSRAQVRERNQPSAAKQEIKRDAETFAERAGMLVMRGYKPKDAVELLLQQTVIECGNDPRMMEKARADAEDFLLRVRRGVI